MAMPFITSIIKFVRTKNNYILTLDGLETCNNVKKENDTHIIYENSIQYTNTEYEGVIFRRKALKIDFACEFARDLEVSAGIG